MNEEMQNVVDYVIASVSEDCHINCDKLSEIISNLQAVKKASLDDWKETLEEEIKIKNKEKEKAGKIYYDSLKDGDEIHWLSKTGEKLTGTVLKTKRSTKTAHVVFEGNNKYIKFYNLIIGD